MQALETCLYAGDLGAAEAFYSGVLGLTLHSKVEGRHLFYRLDGSMLLIFNPEASAKPGDVPAHQGKPGGHACLAIPREQTDEWEARLRGARSGRDPLRLGQPGREPVLRRPSGQRAGTCPGEHLGAVDNWGL